MKYKILIDFDHCLAPFDHDIAAEAVKKELISAVGKDGFAAGDEFGRIFYGMLSILHSNESHEAVGMKEKINSYAVVRPPELPPDADQKWSRELWLKYLSDKYGLHLDGKIIMHIVEKYWETIAQACKLYPDVTEFLRRFGDDVFVITGSDDRMIFRNGSIIYDPLSSERKKIDRLEKQGLRNLLPSNHIITGDPYGKADEKFWQKAMRIAGLEDPADGIVIEDSLSVVLYGKKLGFKGYVLDRHGFYNKDDLTNKIDGYITGLKEFNKEMF
ncbi:MAG: hypothetical protein QMD85_04615 [Candidatus Aenigmarchaeota archaeon]|nr:hypothetical protein [Candidatus Aenigmarchaeota archaeon]MDI6722847.1 hypothetical protein [Candidatus Aenigmarchaeota archaeon]